jgi:uncharacterized zinc-type alcohol dehydrogenase-like protein
MFVIFSPCFLSSTDEADRARINRTLHLIIDTIAGNHEIALLVKMLTTDGVCCMVGIPPDGIHVGSFDIVGNRKTVAGSMIGGIKETQDMLDFCHANNIYPDVDLIGANEVNRALFELSQNEAQANRFIIDMSTLPSVEASSNWQVDSEPRINPAAWNVNKDAVFYPTEANVHAVRK